MDNSGVWRFDCLYTRAARGFNCTMGTEPGSKVHGSPSRSTTQKTYNAKAKKNTDITASELEE